MERVCARRKEKGRMICGRKEERKEEIMKEREKESDQLRLFSPQCQSARSPVAHFDKFDYSAQAM